jgi:SAM-dependent methyltransferase
MTSYPETIDNAWDVLYRDDPEIYDAFASFPYRPGVLQVLRERFDLAGKTRLALGAGGGQSALPLARTARQVIAVEPGPAMRAIGAQQAPEQGIENVTFLAGEATATLLPAAVDVVMAITAPLEVEEALRVVRRPGLLLQLDVAPGCSGGELAAIIAHPTPELEAAFRRRTGDEGFAALDFTSLQEYGTQEASLRTYGLIFCPHAIAHLRQTGQTSIRWTFRLHYRLV